MIRSLGQFLLPVLSVWVAGCAPEAYQAENLSAKPFNQLDLAGNACGLAALLNSYRFGKPAWRNLAETPPGLTDRERIRFIARGPAMRESSSLPGRARWSRNGINLSDLRDVANELSAPHLLQPLSQEEFFLKQGQDQASLLRHVHDLFSHSLKKGIPPILSIRRFAKNGDDWRAIQGHFVTIVSVPGKIPAGEKFFAVRYIDPWGGTLREGSIKIRQTAFLGSDPSANANLEAVFPTATVGKRRVEAHEETMLAVSAGLGHF